MTPRLAIIPARGGSKGIPRKNLALLAGRPLIVHSIDAALAYGRFEPVIVSTDDDEIASVAQAAGARVDRRPAGLATDQAKAIEVLLELMGRTRMSDETTVCLLPPTSPLRSADDIGRAIAEYEGSAAAADSLVSVTDCEFPAQYALVLRGPYVEPVHPEYYAQGKSQRSEVPRQLRPNGALYVARAAELRRLGTFFAPRTLAFEMPAERSVDIDRPIDLMLAELLLERGRLSERPR